jgi:putative DNA methylase
MNEDLKRLIHEKRAWSEPLDAAAKAKGFLGWHMSHRLPHCDYPGKKQLVTYRLADSVPAGLLREWQQQRPQPGTRQYQLKVEKFLDAGHGACFLRNPIIAEIVQANFWYHDSTKYKLHAWVIMPNHAHVLIEMGDVPLAKVLQSLKGFTAHESNRVLRRSGQFWAEDYFDRYIRNDRHLSSAIRYVENNPTKAFLVRSPEEWPWSSARYRSKDDASGRTLIHPKGPR